MSEQPVKSYEPQPFARIVSDARLSSSTVRIRIIVMRYPTRAFQSDTTVVSNDRRRHHRVSQTKAARLPPGLHLPT